MVYKTDISSNRTTIIYYDNYFIKKKNVGNKNMQI